MRRNETPQNLFLLLNLIVSYFHYRDEGKFTIANVPETNSMALLSRNMTISAGTFRKRRK